VVGYAPVPWFQPDEDVVRSALQAELSELGLADGKHEPLLNNPARHIRISLLLASDEM